MPHGPGASAGRTADHELRRALARAERGAALSLDETTALLRARGEALERLLSVASRMRDLGHGDVVTYSRKVFAPLTMLCRDHCHYCTFAKPPAKLGPPFLAPDEVEAMIRRIDALIRHPVFPAPSGERPYPWPPV